MKTSKQFFYPFFIMVVLMGISGCKKDEVIEQTEEEIFMEQISGRWTAASVTLDGKDVSKSFPGLQITISDTKQLTVQNAVPPIWKGSAAFQLQPAGNSFQLLRDDGVLMTLTQPAANRLVLKFLYDADALGGRTESVTGEFTFEFTGS